MFDNLVAAHGPTPRRRARTIVVTTSVIVHGVVLAALAILAMWRIDKLDLDARGTRVNALTLPHDSGGGGRPNTPLVAKTDVKVVKVKPLVTVQPEKEIRKEETPKPDAEAEAGQGVDDALPGNGTGGDRKGSGTPTGPKCETAACLGTTTGAGTGGGEETTCKTGEQKIDGKCIKPKKVEVVPPNIAAGLRKSGNDQIPAPQSVRVSMMHEGKSRVVGTVKLCIGDDGHIDRTTLLKSTGYDAYDDDILEEMSKWRYKPYTVDGDAVPFCTSITIVYVMK